MDVTADTGPTLISYVGAGRNGRATYRLGAHVVKDTPHVQVALTELLEPSEVRLLCTPLSRFANGEGVRSRPHVMRNGSCPKTTRRTSGATSGSCSPLASVTPQGEPGLRAVAALAGPYQRWGRPLEAAITAREALVTLHRAGGAVVTDPLHNVA